MEKHKRMSNKVFETYIEQLSKKLDEFIKSNNIKQW